MVAKPSSTSHEVAKILRKLADEIDKRSAPLPADLAARFVPLVSAAHAASGDLLELMETASRLVRSADIAELAQGLEIEESEAALIRDEIAAVRAGRAAAGRESSSTPT